MCAHIHLLLGPELSNPPDDESEESLCRRLLFVGGGLALGVGEGFMGTCIGGGGGGGGVG